MRFARGRSGQDAACAHGLSNRDGSGENEAKSYARDVARMALVAFNSFKTGWDLLFLGSQDLVSKEEIVQHLHNIMTVAALLAGFTVTAALVITPEELERTAAWEVETFVGYNSSYCRHLKPNRLIGSTAWATNRQCDENLCTPWEPSGYEHSGSSGYVWGHKCTAEDEERFLRFPNYVRTERIQEMELDLGWYTMLTTWMGAPAGLDLSTSWLQPCLALPCFACPTA